MGAPVVHFEILGKDTKALQAFYGDLFDWKISEMEGMDYGGVNTGNEGGIGGGIGSGPNGESMVTFYIQVADIDSTLGQIKSKRGKVVIPRKEIPGVVTFAMFTDPEGHAIGLVEEGSHD